MSLEDDTIKNMELAETIEQLLSEIRPDQRGAIYTMLLIYTAHSLNVSKQELLFMIETFFDNNSIDIKTKLLN